MSKATKTSTDINKGSPPISTNGAPKSAPSMEEASDAIDNNNHNGTDKTQLRIAVGTTNPCKIEAVKKAVEKAIGFSANSTVTASNQFELHVEGFSVESGVPDQPFGDVR